MLNASAYYLGLYACADRVVYTEESFILKSKPEEQQQKKKTNQNLGLKSMIQSREV